MENTKYKSGENAGIRAVIFGGAGAEHDISRLSAGGFIAEARRLGFDVLPIFIDKNGDFYIYNGDVSEIADIGKEPGRKDLLPTFPVRISGKSGFLAGGEVIAVSLAVPVLHGDFGEDGIIQGALRTAHIPFVGEDVCEGALCADKILTKLVAMATGIPTADFTVGEGKLPSDIIATLDRVDSTLGFPVFIKPCRLGSSIGAMAVRDKGEFIPKYTKALSYGSRVLIERLIDVDYEIECALLGVGGEKQVASGVIKTDGRVYDYNEKYKEKNVTPTVAKEKNEAILLAEEYARKLIDTIGLRSISRVDFLVDRGGDVYFNEINTMPGMTETSLYPPLTEAMGYPRGEFISRLISEAICDGDI